MLCKTPSRLFEDASAHSYTVGAFNVFNLDTLTAVLQAAQNTGSPVIIQVSMGTRNYQPSLPLFVRTIKLYAADCQIPVALQHDHCPTVQACREAIQAGFRSVMFDGSHLPYKENLARTREAAQLLHAYGGWLEAEIGRLPGFEDEAFAEHVEYTAPQAAAEFIQRTGCDALAVSVGTSHGGVSGEAPLSLDLQRLKQIQQAVGNYPLVLHGAASLPAHLIEALNRQGAQVPLLRNVPEEQIAASAAYGVRKANMDVDNFLCYTTKVREMLNKRSDKYDPRGYLKPARQAFQAQVEHKMLHVLHCAHRYPTNGKEVLT